jgi:hypothetical protein
VAPVVLDVEVRALQKDLQQMSAVQEQQADIASINERRAIVGLEPSEDPVHDEIRESGRETLTVDVGPGVHAGAHVGVVLRQRNGSGPHVARHLHELERAVAAQVGCCMGGGSWKRKSRFRLAPNLILKSFSCPATGF